ncbi:2-keto-4-pentenoate hydratase [Streptomyces sp. NBC_00690]|uniref:2-keto-4-pentenoate hydratase n=1 Tax=Streptomyces sp. NBC_00690 TaxID=2975808 RepID=UPI002E289329|nr:fumarylacetoacetate hydrolase family protein [Streptomyces sp. NBC_00690]
MTLAQLTEILDAAAVDGHTVDRPTDSIELTLPDAYAVQRAVIERRLARGESSTGVKMGFTSRAKMVQMGVDDVIWGLLTDAMQVEDGAVLDLGGLIHPRIEPEIAFLIGSPISGRITPAEAVRSLAGVAVAYEVLDSRYEGFRFTLPDVIADNASAARYGCGIWQPADVRDLSNIGLLVEIDGRVVATGSSAAILGHPLRSLVAAARLAGEAGIALEPGQIVLAGAATAALPLPRGAHVRILGDGLGGVEVTTR